jgi:hypothetical protein
LIDKTLNFSRRRTNHQTFLVFTDAQLEFPTFQSTDPANTAAQPEGPLLLFVDERKLGGRLIRAPPSIDNGPSVAAQFQ